MAATWPTRPRLIGTRSPRIGGSDTATGAVRYAADLSLPGLLHAILIRCPHAHARIKSIDATAAEKLPGFKALYPIRNKGAELFFAGEDVLALAADTEAHARDAARAVVVEYALLPHLVTEQGAREKDRDTAALDEKKWKRANHAPLDPIKSAAFDVQMKADPGAVAGPYGVPEMRLPGDEPDAAVALWDEKKETLTVWLSAGSLPGAGQALAEHFDIPTEKVTCHAPPGDGIIAPWPVNHLVAIAAARLARLTGAPVKLIVPPPANAAGSALGTVRVAGRKDGSLLAVEIDTAGTSPAVVVPTVYAWEHHVKHLHLRLNRPRPLLNPMAGCYLTECAIDDFANRLGISPMDVRTKSLSEGGQGPIYRRQIDQIVKLADWALKWRAPGTVKGVVKKGIGLALHAWSGPPSLAAQVNVTIYPDGAVVVAGVRRERGTAQRTEAAVIVADVLGLAPRNVTVDWRDAQVGTASPQLADAVLSAVLAARDNLFEQIAPGLRVEKDNLEIAPGEVREKGGKGYPWKIACGRLGTNRARGKGTVAAAASVDLGGAQVAEVSVDTETGVVRVLRLVAVQECGRIINRLTLESQVVGDVTIGVNQALYEQWSWDEALGRVYRQGARPPLTDLPRISAHFMEQSERGPLALGGPPTPATAAAIGNAILNAIGVRVPEPPFTPDRVLAALARRGA